ncbi:hypothetical protein acsn021_36040 [Anaerocolumna cellulosilytica]|uniref:Uncharacterized protein n=1 Tax=Anaerocolumna cellulosilytica TaxID=433286 RepID=A0A6S6RA97_9FIRM|nr:hypothetical protein [Anaerocolumna cellulosilytica]MBB5195502.1 hypothetical protein [Anaerocolumna cellulosilytica]BCJ96035.1 hypothetical protein acsn021_36040 [Anaerocolumna cellulosilytica]
MYDEMNQELEKLRVGIQKDKKKLNIIKDLEKQLMELERKEADLSWQLKKEEEDVEKLNKASITVMFYTILGSKDKQMEKERQEALAVRLKLEETLSEMDAIKNSIYKLRTERMEYSGYEQKYNTLYEQKYNLLKNSGREDAKQIIDIEEAISFCQSNLKEIEEAITVGKRIIDRVLSAESSLSSAEGWGVWDMLGGGLITDMVKHSHIDDAKAAVSEIQSLLNQFRSELTDIKIESDIEINIEGFVKFADFFFDGLIADWVIQSRINDSKESVSQVKRGVESVLSRLENMKRAAKGQITGLRTQLTILVESK